MRSHSRPQRGSTARRGAPVAGRLWAWAVTVGILSLSAACDEEVQVVCVDERLSVDGLDLQARFTATTEVDVADVEGDPSALINAAKLRVHRVPEERVDTADFKIESIATWSAGYGNQFFCRLLELTDVPTEQGQQRVYPLNDVDFNFIRQPVIITNTVTGATHEIASLTVNDRFVGWARRGTDALVLERSGRPTMYILENPTAVTPREIELIGRDLQFLDGDRFLAAVYTSNPCSGSTLSGPLVHFIDDTGQKTEEIGWLMVPAGEALTLEIYAEDMQTFQRRPVTSSPMPDLGGWQGAVQYDVAISGDGSQVFFTLKVHDWDEGTVPFTLHYLLSLDEQTVSLVDPDTVDFLSSPPPPSNTSFSGTFSTAVASRSWSGSLSIMLEERDEGFLFASDKSTTADRLTYSYQLQLSSGMAELTETGAFQLGYHEPFCEVIDD